ncbi:MAG: hypothetical protein GY711_26230 [bacterium]|nr:hypothetical protein [bacterium]
MHSLLSLSPGRVARLLACGLAASIWAPRVCAQCNESVLEPAPGAPLQLFGTAASFALSGATAVVGTVLDDTAGNLTGSVHVFDRQGAGWVLATRLFPPQPLPQYSLGTSVAIRGDTIFAGTRADSDDGSVLVYQRQAGTWTAIQELGPAPNGSAVDARFGRGVHAFRDGITVVAPGQERIYFFEEQAGTWVETGWIDPGVLAPFGFDPAGNVFGTGVSTSGDRIAIENLAGPVYVVELQPGGAWAAIAELEVPGVDWALHQATIAGGTVAVGYAGAGSSGAVYVFEEDGGSWVHAQTLTPSDAIPDQAFGAHVSLFEDRLLVGSNLDDSVVEDGGSAYLFERSGGSWSEVQKIEPDAPVQRAAFGDGVLLWGDSAVVGAPGTLAGSGRGALHVFDLEDEQGTPYCPTNPTSSGLAAKLRATGNRRAILDCLTFDVAQLPPGQFGLFLMSRDQSFVPSVGGGDGNLCLALPFVRFSSDIQVSDGAGNVVFSPDLGALPGGASLAPGDTWSFQYWTRDGATSNLSNGLSVTFATGDEPTVQFPEATANVTEESTTYEALVMLSEPTHGIVLVPFATGGSAEHQVDWRIEETNPLSIPAGATSFAMTIIVAEDAEVEGDETATITLLDPTGAAAGTQTVFSLTIVDDD